MRKDEKKSHNGFMPKRAFLTFLFVAVVFTSVGLAQTTQLTHYYVRFKAVKAFVLEPNSPYAVPVGEYILREISPLPSPGHIFSLDRASDKKSMALLSTIRVKSNRSDKSGLGFDYEKSQLPVLKRFFVRGTDGWEITNVEYKKDAGLINAAAVSQY